MSSLMRSLAIVLIFIGKYGVGDVYNPYSSPSPGGLINYQTPPQPSAAPACPTDPQGNTVKSETEVDPDSDPQILPRFVVPTEFEPYTWGRAWCEVSYREGVTVRRFEWNTSSCTYDLKSTYKTWKSGNLTHFWRVWRGGHALDLTLKSYESYRAHGYMERVDGINREEGTYTLKLKSLERIKGERWDGALVDESPNLVAGEIKVAYAGGLKTSIEFSRFVPKNFLDWMPNIPYTCRYKESHEPLPSGDYRDGEWNCNADPMKYPFVQGMVPSLPVAIDYAPKYREAFSKVQLALSEDHGCNEARILEEMGLTGENLGGF